MNARASRLRWGAFVALAVAAPLAIVGSYRHAHAAQISSALSSPRVSTAVDAAANDEEADLFLTHHVRSAAQLALESPPTPQKSTACQFGKDRTCNEDASVSKLRGTCRHDGSCACSADAEKTKDGRCR